MGFYSEPAFFILLVPVIAVAAMLGVREKPLRAWGFAATVLMLGLLFSRDLASLAFAVCYLIGTAILARLVLRLFQTSHQHRIGWYRVALGLQVAPLVVYKVGVAADPGFLGFIGISYITFKAMQVLIEIRDGLIDEVNVMDHLYFLMFFPTFTSGPVMRSRQFVADIRSPLSRDSYLDRLYRGLGWLVVGAVYKYVGAAVSGWLLWFLPAAVEPRLLQELAQMLAYGLYLFFDFAGYSHMAMGVGLCMGVETPRNFRAPFLATDPIDFWNRWHISLSTWLRDFVFMRFSQAALRRKLFKSRLTIACVAFFINFVLMGLWHGISWNNLAYGLFWGAALSLTEVAQKRWPFYKAHRKSRWFQACSWVVTMCVVFFSFAIFSGQVAGWFAA